MNFCLLARRDTSLEQLERVLGHSQVSISDIHVNVLYIYISLVLLLKNFWLIGTQALKQTKTFLQDLGVQKDIVDEDQFYARVIFSFLIVILFNFICSLTILFRIAYTGKKRRSHG